MTIINLLLNDQPRSPYQSGNELSFTHPYLKGTTYPSHSSAVHDRNMSKLIPSFQFIAQERQLRRRNEQANAMRQLENRAGRGSLRELETDSDAESSDGDEDSDSDDSVQYQLTDLPAADLPTAEATIGVSSYPTTNKSEGAPTSTNQGQGNLSGGGTNPPSLWGKSKPKQRIIEELKDDNSDIHLLIGSYNATSFSNVNFVQIFQKYADNKYNMSNFKENLKRLLKHHLGKTGPFEAEGVEPWYTTAKM